MTNYNDFSQQSEWNTTKPILRLLQYVVKEKLYWITAFVSALFMVTAEAGFAWVLKALVNLFENFSQNKSEIWVDQYLNTFIEMPSDPIAYLWILLAIAGILALLKLSAGFVQEISSNLLGRAVLYKLRENLFINLIDQPMSFYDQNKTGVLSSVINNDVSRVETFCQTGLIAYIREPLTIIVMVIVMLVIDWQLFLWIILFAPIIVGAIYLVGNKVRKIEKELRIRLAELTARIYEAIVNMQIVKAFAKENWEKSQFKQENLELWKKEKKFYKIRALGGPAAEFFGLVGVIIILGIGGTLILNNEGGLSLGGFVAFVFALLRVSGPIQSLSKVYILTKQTAVSASRIFYLINRNKNIRVLPIRESDKQLISNTKQPAKIEVRNLFFAYSKGKPILKNINFVIPKGKIVAIVGPSGAGKSTLVHLLLGLYSPDSGQILIDDLEITCKNRHQLNINIAFVPQDNQVFANTIVANIAYGNPDIPFDDVQSAAKLANAHEFIERLPDNYHTYIGERGVKLSGGQRQRIAIARAMLVKPAILIFDEATSFLDPVNEAKIQQTIKQISKKQTSIIIAHRASTIAIAEQLIFLENGQISAQGTHEELFSSCANYRNFYNYRLD